MKVLNIVETAYRATLEEQDDTILWLSQSFQSAGTDVSILLRGNAVNYLVRGQKSFNLSFGTWQQTHPPELSRDLEQMIEKGIVVYAIEEDIEERSLPQHRLIKDVLMISKKQIASLFDRFEHVWHW